METLTDTEKQALSKVMDHYIHHLCSYRRTEASIKFHYDLRNKLNLILFPPEGHD